MSESKIIPFPGVAPEALDEVAPRLKGHPDQLIMRSDLVEKASELIPDPPVLINMVSQRVRQLNNGRPPLIQIVERMGAADIALREIIEQKIVLSHNGKVEEEDVG